MITPDPQAEARAETMARRMASAQFGAIRHTPALTPRGPLLGERERPPGPARLRGVYILLGLLLGALGAHNFYAGYYGRGSVQLVGSLILAIVFPPGLLGILMWVLADLFFVRHDARGRTLY